MNYFNKKERLIIFQMKDSRNIKSSCQIPIKRNFVSRDIYVEVKEQDDKELLGAMGRVVYE